MVVDIMYVIIVYDVNVERVNKVKSFLRQYLFWIQNSVFEGELTKSEFKKVTDGLVDIIDNLELVTLNMINDLKVLIKNQKNIKVSQFDTTEFIDLKDTIREQLK